MADTMRAAVVPEADPAARLSELGGASVVLTTPPRATPSSPSWAGSGSTAR
ncbi:hypothetical protein C463_14935 [Halorubrum californiense DSM 19288]|uniref:Uncharacterized protein n=1 Tax=Halorubrum californiense DSM 19288 TaxID=1227465 RepID=M0E0Q3_9EURY|nr:hypothetical protein C463_14935 [Halorubrum californiense DSM 19288]